MCLNTKYRTITAEAKETNMQPTNSDDDRQSSADIFDTPPPDAPTAPRQSTSPRLVLQPLSTEESIREDVLAAAPISKTPLQTSPNSSPSPQPAARTNTTTVVGNEIIYSGEVEDYEVSVSVPSSSLASPNLNSSTIMSPSVGIPPLQHSSVVVPVRHHARLPIIGIVAVLLLIGASVVYYLFFSSRVTTSQLVTETTGTSSYLRPSQWKPLPISASSISSGFGNFKGKDNKSSAIVTFAVTPRQIPVLINATDSIYDTFRAQLTRELEGRSSNLATNFNAGTIGCANDPTVSVESTSTKNNTTVGLILVVTKCDTASNGFTMRTQIVAGNDGYVRMINVGAYDREWDRSNEAFEAILRSVEVIKSSQTS